MTYAFAAYEQLHQGDVLLAIFWDRSAAATFAKSENDAYQAEVVCVETIPLVDRYGFPCRIDELAAVAPWAAA